jgi:hypothetical protein
MVSEPSCLTIKKALVHTCADDGPPVRIPAINRRLKAPDGVQRALPSTAGRIGKVRLDCAEPRVSAERKPRRSFFVGTYELGSRKRPCAACSLATQERI